MTPSISFFIAITLAIFLTHGDASKLNIDLARRTQITNKIRSQLQKLSTQNNQLTSHATLSSLVRESAETVPKCTAGEISPLLKSFPQCSGCFSNVTNLESVSNLPLLNLPAGITGIPIETPENDICPENCCLNYSQVDEHTLQLVFCSDNGCCHRILMYVPQGINSEHVNSDETVVVYDFNNFELEEKTADHQCRVSSEPSSKCGQRCAFSAPHCSNKALNVPSDGTPFQKDVCSGEALMKSPHGSEHGESEHGESEHEESEHEESEHGESEHGESEHGESEHGESEHEESEHGDSEHGESEHGESEHGGSEHGESEPKEHEHEHENHSAEKPTGPESHGDPNSHEEHTEGHSQEDEEHAQPNSEANNTEAETTDEFGSEEATHEEEPNDEISQPFRNAEATDASSTDDSEESNEPSCFPSGATVHLADGSTTTMESLSVGDIVRCSSGINSPIIAFSHIDKYTVSNFVEFTTAGGEVVRATKGHYITVNGRATEMRNVKLGDIVDLVNGEQRMITKVRTVSDRGLYNPHTVCGEIAVNGVVMSTYTNAMKDVTAHAMLAPIRATADWMGMISLFSIVVESTSSIGRQLFYQGTSAFVRLN